MQYDLSPIRTTLPVHPPLLTEVDHLRLAEPYGKRTLGVGRDFLGFGQEGTPRPRPREKSQDRPGREWGRGVRGKTHSQKAPKGLELFSLIKADKIQSFKKSSLLELLKYDG